MSDELNQENIVDLSKQSIEESIESFCRDLMLVGFDKAIVRTFGNRFTIVDGDSLGKSYDGTRLSKEDYKKFRNAISDFCIKNNINKI